MGACTVTHNEGLCDKLRTLVQHIFSIRFITSEEQNKRIVEKRNEKSPSCAANGKTKRVLGYCTTKDV